MESARYGTRCMYKALWELRGRNNSFFHGGSRETHSGERRGSDLMRMNKEGGCNLWRVVKSKLLF